MVLSQGYHQIEAPKITLKDGNKIPQFGLGTWCLLKGRECRSVVYEAMELGYLHIDTATFYENQDSIGDILSGNKRQKIHITSKLWVDDMGKNETIAACEQCLKDLKTDYIDLYLIHWPYPREKILETLDAMYCLQKQGKIKSVGVSNFTVNHLKDVMAAGFEVVLNQIEMHPYFNQIELQKFCQENQIALTAYCPIARGAVTKDFLLNNIGHKYGKTAVQVTLRWQLQHNRIVIPKTAKKARLLENINIFDFSLNDEEMQKIDNLNKNFRLVSPDCGDFDY